MIQCRECGCEYFKYSPLMLRLYVIAGKSFRDSDIIVNSLEIYILTAVLAIVLCFTKRWAKRTVHFVCLLLC